MSYRKRCANCGQTKGRADFERWDTFCRECRAAHPRGQKRAKDSIHGRLEPEKPERPSPSGRRVDRRYRRTSRRTVRGERLG